MITTTSIVIAVIIVVIVMTVFWLIIGTMNPTIRVCFPIHFGST